ncbi:DsbA family oxidoreductase [Bacillus horti]|uniref:DsbA family dithiol-disulfide isomerase n=1 Tax=Caldalkalibacillus horti TaxID=77523 RepID=A0ABT9VV82_9BACI|nr:DsbA family oxidoreductase [Bacillus horti]MDQ0164903.1 putative DsbA family dithiol-disulfide isomerase [Bacillus horti]
MKVEIWSDYMCPFCYIGKRKFEVALEQFAHKDRVEVTYRSFELDPGAKRDNPESVYEMLSAKYNVPVEQAKAMNQNVAKQAEEVGLTYHFDTMELTNSFDAHRLTHFAAHHGKSGEIAEKLFHAVFTASKNIGQHNVLIELATEAGLDLEETTKMLQGDHHTLEVHADEQEAKELGIRGVPYFVIDRKYAISGAQSSDVFLDTLQKAWGEARPLTVVNETSPKAGQDYCSDGECKA